MNWLILAAGGWGWNYMLAGPILVALRGNWTLKRVRARLRACSRLQRIRGGHFVLVQLDHRHAVGVARPTPCATPRLAISPST